MSRRFAVPADTEMYQRQAAHPDWSVWVAANAGSGKTHVLTQRVLRLLLSGAKPEAILCLTYTKAAAAEMRNRVSKKLGVWAVLDDASLDIELKKLDQTPTEALRRVARTLFARALETPGGLKIVTIHAFCESVLHRFPLEAGVPFDFTVIEDVARADLVLSAREAVLAEGLRDASSPVSRLFERLSDHSIAEAIDCALGEGRKLRGVLADAEGAKARLRRFVGHRGRSVASIEADMIEARHIGAAERSAILAASPPGSPNTLEGRLSAIDPDTIGLDPWNAVFFTGSGSRRADLAKSRLAKIDIGLYGLIEDEAERLETLLIERTGALLVERSEALLEVLQAIAARYEAGKRARALLDFDDLIEKLADLFADAAQGPWVRYKLDAGIHHILVDESQDTNPEQWRVVREIAQEFFVGEGQVDRPRSLFAVGDPKQSIYSFQGAEPRLFRTAGEDFAKASSDAGRSFKTVPLHTSFRTLRGVLEAVDLVCDRQDIQDALLASEKVHHDTARIEPGGSVTLWPPEHRPKVMIESSDWPLEPPETPAQSAQRIVAMRIATEIKGWLAAGRRLANGRMMTPDDVLILVQSRSAVFSEIIRALLIEALPTPGADRLGVTNHIAVLDLLALADILANPADDLQLAAVLRSPLFDIGEDDLFAIAHNRGKASLWQALGETGDVNGASAYRILHRWRGRLDFDRPFEFFTHVLYAENGLKRFHARLGLAVDDVMAEFLALALDHEQDAQPSLLGFVAAMRQQNISIKRDLAESGGGVRVMTVHGAKGLEAPIVILADAATKPAAKQTGKPVYILGMAEGGPALIHAGPEADHVPSTLAIREAAKDNLGQEYWRKLYVGMTRAEEALYVTGALTPGQKPDTALTGTWYEAIETALSPRARRELHADGTLAAIVYPALDAELPDTEVAAAAGAPIIPAPFVLGTLPPYHPRWVVRPSSAFETAPRATLLETALEASRDADLARRSGIALHALLQHLSAIGPDDRLFVAKRAMPELLPGDLGLHASLMNKAIGILENPAFSAIFGPGSRAEVPFLTGGKRNGQNIRLAGRIDRLVVDANGVMVIDYKSDAALPASAEAVPGNYLTQLGLYALVASQLFPHLPVRAAILWTSMESLMNLPDTLLAAATADFTIG